jgi:hypothetical protein
MRVCACSCGRSLEGRRSQCVYATDTCRVRGHRNRTRETVTSLPSIHARRRTAPALKTFQVFKAIEENRNGLNCNGLEQKRCCESSIHLPPRNVCRGRMSNCQRCGTLGETIERLKDDVQSLQAQNVGQLRVIGQLRRELAEQAEAEPDADKVKGLLALWRTEHHDDDKRVLIRLDGPRGQRVRWALKRYPVERLERAILGALLDDWAMGRDRRTKGRTYNDVAKHIFKDEETIERFERLFIEGGKARSSDTPPLERVLGKLEGVREDSTGQWVARCPAHEDAHASLRVCQGNKGVVLRCYAGCLFADITAALGERETDLFDREPRQAVVAKPAPDPLPSEAEVRALSLRLLANEKAMRRVMELRRWSRPALERLQVGFDGQRLVFPIRDENKTLVNLLRYKPGNRRDGERKLLGTKGRSRDLFPAPEIHEGEVWLVEGEPDAVSGLTLGLSTTAVPGVNGWRSNWTGRFEGRRVVVCFDCDAPGRGAASKVALALAPAAKDVRLVDLAPDRNDGFDMTDFLVSGGDAGVLRRLADEAGSVMAHRRAA